MTEPERRPRPRAFRLDGDTVVPPKTAREVQEQARPFATKVIEPEEDVFASGLLGGEGGLDADEQAVEEAQAGGLLRRFILSWGGVFWSALTGLISLAVTLWVTKLVEDLFAHSALLGTIGFALAAALAVAALILFAREIRTMMRQNKIAKLHIALAKARADDDGKSARERLVELCGVYEKRPETARARARVLQLSREIINGRDLIDLAERTLVLPLDEVARREIASASKRVPVVTTISPRALIDVIFVAAQAVALMRRIAEIYGGRSGPVGFFQTGALRGLASRDHRRPRDRRLAVAAIGRPRHSGEGFGAARRRRAERSADRARWTFRHGGVPPHAFLRREATGSCRSGAVLVRRQDEIMILENVAK